MSDTPSRVLIDLVYQLANGTFSITNDMTGHPLGDCHQFVVDHQHTVIKTFDIAFNQYRPAAAMLPGKRKRALNLLIRCQVN